MKNVTGMPTIRWAKQTEQTVIYLRTKYVQKKNKVIWS